MRNFSGFLRVVSEQPVLQVFRGHAANTNRSIFRPLAAMIAAAILSAAMPAPGFRPGSSIFLLGNVRVRRRNSKPSPLTPTPPTRSAPSRASAALRSAVQAVAYCVRTCDGHFFPIQRNSSVSPVETCQSFCPSAQTKIYNGSSIANSVSVDGRRYSDLPNAFAYRDKIVANCSCNGKTAFRARQCRCEKRSDAALRRHRGDA